MNYRFLGRSGLQVSELCFGTMTFGGVDFFKDVGNTQVKEARQMVDICMEAGITLFDTADMYSNGTSEKILGEAIGKERRDKVLIATKAFFRTGPGIHDIGLSRQHIIQACEASLKRLGTDYIDLYQVHNFDALTPLEETLYALETLVRDGKVRYIGCSNYSGWHLMKALALAKEYQYQPFISQQIYYSLLARDAEHELIPVSLDQGVGMLIWSPLSSGLLSGKYRRDQKPTEGRIAQMGNAIGPPVDYDRLYRIVDVLDAIAKERSKTVAQVALNWLLRRPMVSSIIIGARNEQQLRDNLAAVGWSLSSEEVNRLDKASESEEPYPLWHQHMFAKERNPLTATAYQA